MEGNKKITLNKVVHYLSVGVLVVSLLFTFKSFGDKATLDKKEDDMPAFQRLSIIDGWRRDKASANMKIGGILSLVSGGAAYLTYTNKLDIESVINNNKKKIKKELSKKLKQVLEEE